MWICIKNKKLGGVTFLNHVDLVSPFQVIAKLAKVPHIAIYGTLAKVPDIAIYGTLANV